MKMITNFDDIKIGTMYRVVDHQSDFVIRPDEFINNDEDSLSNDPYYASAVLTHGDSRIWNFYTDDLSQVPYPHKEFDIDACWAFYEIGEGNITDYPEYFL